MKRVQKPRCEKLCYATKRLALQAAARAANGSYETYRRPYNDCEDHPGAWHFTRKRPGA